MNIRGVQAFGPHRGAVPAPVTDRAASSTLESMIDEVGGISEP